ncbi:cytotoxic translational repressor of toxin-antitoxin stability system [Nocardiopsis coralli]|uniref:cytotoxic translational repressor of toxin-antitoxin stability system n=1 Tax=Nocardiopsis coralli TaxID=2772213 RepID=UPI002E2AFDD7|nr:cytotoxic translational repressor of toxin-antitoxin stability system [Nocardiopsis coralli]
MEGWTPVRSARGRTGTHHITYELALADGRVLRTRISRPADRSDHGKSMWAHILRDQLEVDEDTFWSCVQEGVRPDRGVPEVPVGALPADLVHLLMTNLGLDGAEVARMSKEEAVARLQRYWMEGG